MSPTTDMGSMLAALMLLLIVVDIALCAEESSVLLGAGETGSGFEPNVTDTKGRSRVSPRDRFQGRFIHSHKDQNFRFFD